MLACLALGACVANSSGPRPASLPDASPPFTADLAGTVLEFVPAPGSDLELQGTTTIGPWASRSTDIHGRVILDADEAALGRFFSQIEAAAANDRGAGPPPLPTLPVRSPPIANISVPVMSLRGSSSAMDRDMHNALKAAQHPEIEYTFQQLQAATLQRGPEDDRYVLKLRIAGKLNMAGADRPITMDVIVRRDPRGHFLAHAQATLLMSDFGVTPPVAAFGLIKAGDRVLAVFDLDLVESTRPHR
jgi:hypothetical protein